MEIKKPNSSKPYINLSAVDIDVMNNLNSIKKMQPIIVNYINPQTINCHN